MSEITLVIGNKNYSSWSLRAWLTMKHLKIPFREVLLQLSTPEFKEELEKYGPIGRVPVLKQGTLYLWDSLAIAEYAAELAGEGWPADREARALARCVSAEMHSGFGNLRSLWPLNARARNRHTAMTTSLESDIDRIDEIWNQCRHRYGAGGPWLFGEWSIADAMFAPVVLRFNTYGARISETARWYMASVLEDDAMQEWLAAAKDEPWTLKSSEVGLTAS